VEIEQIRSKLEELSDRFSSISSYYNIEQLKAEVGELELQLQDEGIWSDNVKANKVNKELVAKKAVIGQLSELDNDIKSSLEMVDMLYDSKDEVDDFISSLNSVTGALDQLETNTYLTGKHDAAGAIIEIITGVGGQDAQDFSAMLERMYLGYAKSHDYNAVVLQTTYGELNGIKSTTIKIDEQYAYGLLKYEAGTHRLVRLSPFNSKAKRETSFSGVEVYPIIENDLEITIDPQDLKIDVFRSSGPGGQSVNTTDSAVRITHLPTGITVSVQNEKSQLQNKNVAIGILKSKLLVIEEEKQAKEKSDLSSNTSRAWGDQIRSYVLHPYKLVKDLRSGYEDTNPKKVLDGNIDEFLHAELVYFNNSDQKD
jgi:peptide chain release factor 2